MVRSIISTDKAPQAIGTYSQAVISGNTVYISGQIPLVPETMELVQGDVHAQITQVFKNLKAIAEASGGSLDDVVKLNISVIDLKHFPLVNEIMSELFGHPYPARAVIGVAELPKDAQIEIEAILVLSN